MRKRHRITRYFMWFLLGWLLLLVLLVLLTQIQSVQRYAAQKGVSWLSDKLQTEIQFDDIHWVNFQKLELTGFLIRDQESDTLVAMRQLAVHFSPRSLLQNKFTICDLDLSDGVVNLSQGVDSTWNYQFILDAFATDNALTDTVSSTWEIDPRTIQLRNVRFTYKELGSALHVRFPRLISDFNSVDLTRQQVEMHRLSLDAPYISYVQSKLADPPLSPINSTYAFVFPDLGWNIKLNSTVVTNGQIKYNQASDETNATSGFDPSNVQLDSLFWDMSDVIVESNKMAISIANFGFRDHSGLRIQHLQSDLIWSDSLTRVANFKLQTPKSTLELTSEFRYPTFQTAFEILTNSSLSDSKDFSISLEKLNFDIAPAEIKNFWPGLIPDNWNEQIKLSGAIVGTLKDLQIDELSMSQGKELKLQMKGKIRNPLHAERLHVNLQIDQLLASYKSLKPLLPANTLPTGIAPWGNIQASGTVEGNLEDILAKRLRIKTTSGPQFLGDVKINGLSVIETALITLSITDFKTKKEDWAGFIPDSLPAFVDNLGDIVLTGNYKGTTTTFDTDVKLTSGLGALAVDAYFNFNADYSNGTYQGNIQFDEFDIGKVVGDTSLGLITLQGQLDGQGIQPKDWDTDIQLSIKNIMYDGYSYDSLAVIGRLERARFDGDVSMNDQHLKFNFSGSVPVSDSITTLVISLALDTIDLLPLGFSDRAIGLSMKLKGSITDFNIDNLRTQMVVSDLIISDTLESIQFDSIILSSAVDENGIRNLTLKSDFIQFGLSGEYQLSTLPSEIEDWLAQDFPIQQILHPLETGETAPLASQEDNQFPTPPTNIKGYIRVSDPTKITSMFFPELKRLDTAVIELEFDKSKKLWELDASIPSLVYGDLKVDSLIFNSNYRALIIKSQITATQIQNGANTIIPKPTIDITLKEDQLFFEANASAPNDSIAWKFGGALTTNGKEIKLVLDPSLRIQGQDWKIQSDDIVFQHTNQWQINKLALLKDDASITMDGKGDINSNTSEISVGFSQLNIDLLAPILDFPIGFMSGELNGRVKANDIQNNLTYTADLSLNDWVMDSISIGDLRVLATQKPDAPVIFIEGELIGAINDVDIVGNYNIDDQTFDVEANFKALAMRSLDPFLVDMIHDSEGFLSGTFTLTGSPDRPKLAGALNLNNVKTTIDYINIAYRIDDAQITIDQKTIELGQLNFRHGEDETAVLSGTVSHDYFQNFVLNCKFKTDKFRFLNTTAVNNDLFYGTVLLKMDMDIVGPVDAIEYRIDASTLSGTELFVVPLTDEQVVSQENYIIFGRPAFDSVGRDTNYLQINKLSAPGIDLQLNLEMTPEAKFQIIIDPLSGDKLVCSGTSNLSVDMDPNGTIEVVGNYEIDEGKYFFSYEQLVKREFDILANSKISFDGDPLQARLDITAAFQTRVPLSDLVDNQVSSVQNTLSSLRTDVRVLMKIGGNLASPELTFDIELVGNPQGAVADAARTRLQQLRINETDLNTQVFGLLLFNSFITDNKGGQSVAGAGEAIVLSSLSKLVSNQLNKLASGVLKGVELNLGFEAYNPGIDAGSSVTTEVQLGLSKSLLNDRLTVKVGGNLNVGANGEEEETLTALTGDFALEYRLKENGNSILRVYQRSDYDALYEGNVSKTGVGISIRKELKNKELKNKERKNKK